MDLNKDKDLQRVATALYATGLIASIYQMFSCVFLLKSAVMEEIHSKFIGDKGGFFILDEGRQIGEMTATIKDNIIYVHHTEVKPEAEGKGYAGKLLQFMVDYARRYKMQVVPECPYVLGRFRRNHELYADIWKLDTHS